MSLYQLDNITRTFGRRTALSIDSLSINAGKIYALLGPNGAGKTTLINILGFLDRPSSGRLSFDGTEVDYSKNRLRQFRKNVVVVSQRPVLFSTSVYKNLEFGLKIRRIEPRQRQTIIQSALELVGLQHLSGAPAVKLSGGETQRIVLARALALSPRIIICDEPTASVDLESQVAVMDLLRTINSEKGITIILSSHDRLQSTRLAHETLFLDHGRLFDNAYENMFTFEFSSHNDTGFFYSLNRNMPLGLERDIGQKGRLLLDPWKIELAPQKAASAVEFDIVQITREKEGIRMVLNAGIQLVVMISNDRYLELRPMVGDRIRCQIPDCAVRVI